jgi:formyltetrahydrofolate-dependent phosphoribosylglycinamide formyltransferase
MLKKLAAHWRVSSLQAVLILCTFAIGGYSCGKVGSLILNVLHIKKSTGFYIPYILIVTLVWPLCVLAVSVVFGQFAFFKAYVVKMLSRLMGKKKTLKHVAIFASGNGSNALQVLKYFNKHAQIKIAVIVCNNSTAGVLTHAQNFNVPTIIINKASLNNTADLLNQLQTYKVDYIALAGFLLQVPAALVNAYTNKIINIHPALLPAHGGKGMYGKHVHQAVLNNNDTQSGITIHFVDEQYDHGAIIFKATCSVSATDTTDTLAQKIQQLEHQHFAPVLEKVILHKTS